MDDRDGGIGDLRSRRRLQTRIEVGDAAIQLFGKHGVAGTTVDDIAVAAGISPRTFFRYFTTKEGAAFAFQHTFDAAVDQLALTAQDPAGILTQIEDMYEDLFRTMGPEDTQRACAVQKLIAVEPALRVAADAHHKSSILNLRAKILTALASEPDFEWMLIVEVAASTVNTALEAWTRTSCGSGVDLADTYAGCRRALRRITSL